MDLNSNQLENEFRRQIYLNSGIGKNRMTEILNEQFKKGTDLVPCEKCGKDWSLLEGHHKHICK